jgi:putative tributyrin esterase
MAFVQLHWRSQVLGKDTATWILLPDAGSGPFATFYLLHGLTDDHTAWMLHTRIRDYAAALPLIVVMPDGGRGYFTNQTNGPRWATHMAEELPAYIEKIFPAKTSRESRCVGGLSMGGYGALRLALGYPQRYISANSHSAPLLGANVSHGSLSVAEFERIFGPAYEKSEHDLIVLAKRVANDPSLPKLRIDCGSDDLRLQDNRQFHEALQALNIGHEYQEFPGNHNWDYWDEHIKEALAFHAQVLGIGKGI